MTDAPTLANEILGYPGRMISASKSAYSRAHPGNLVVFNSNVCTKDAKIWYGDIDVTLDEEKLKQLAKALGERIYVLYEMDARFENEDNPLLDKAVYEASPDCPLRDPAVYQESKSVKG